MSLVSLNCPNCGGSLKMEDTMKKCFCMYCGTSFLLKDEIQRVQVEHSGTVDFNLNRQTEINNLIIRAEQKIDEYRNLSTNVTIEQITNDYIEKIFDLDPLNEKAKLLKQALIEAEEAREEARERDEQESIRQDQEKWNKFGFICIAVFFGIALLIYIWYKYQIAQSN